MPEAATPLLWVGSVEGHVCMKGATEAVHLAIAVSRPGVYSLAQGLQIDATLTEKEPGTPVTSSKMEFTLIVENQDAWNYKCYVAYDSNKQFIDIGPHFYVFRRHSLE